MATLLKTIFWLSTAVLLASCWKYDEFSEPMPIQSRLDDEPVQRATRKDPFNVTANDVEYRIQPLFTYDLHGLVVSFRHHDGKFMLHRLWNDHLNVADLCVIWGRNARELKLNLYEFRNAQFTCYVEAPTRELWQAFEMGQLSNNHLLTEKPSIRSAIEGVEVGDQIHLTGYLAEYSNQDGFHRGSSTVRTDTGNGTCETIYLDSFAIVQPMESIWRKLVGITSVGALLSTLLWLIGVARGKY